MTRVSDHHTINHMPQSQAVSKKASTEKTPQRNAKRCCKITAVFMGALLVSVGLSQGIEALNHYRACREWERANPTSCKDWGIEADKLDWREYRAFTTAAWRKWDYKSRAETNCEANPEYEFCKGDNYPPKDNLPAEWRIIDPEWCDTEEGRRWMDERNYPGMPLTCFNRVANTTRNFFMEERDALTAKLAERPPCCSPKKLTCRDSMDYSTLFRNGIGPSETQENKTTTAHRNGEKYLIDITTLKALTNFYRNRADPLYTNRSLIT